MNYITQLQQCNKELQETVDRYQTGIAELMGYLCSPKFWKDTTVQTKDVLNRLEAVNEYAFGGEE